MRDCGEGKWVAFYSYNELEKLEKFLQGKPVAEQEIGRQLLLETIAFAETSMCRRNYILHYCGESFDEDNCNEMCDNCRHPNPKFNGEEYITQLRECVLAINERLKAKEIVKVLVGESNALIKQHKSEALEEYGKCNHKSKGFWHAVIRQSLVKVLLVKEIESYGILKISEK